MADPGTLIAAGSLVTGLAGAATSAVGAESQAKATAAQATYQAQVAANNQIIANQNAEAAVAQGDVQAQNQSLQNAARVGGIIAAQGASGVDVNSGSNLDVQKSQREVGELDAQTIRYNAAQQARGFEEEAASAGGQAGLYNAEAAYAPVAGDIGAAGSLLGGASSVGAKYASWLQQGGGSGTTGGVSSVTQDIVTGPPT